ncbi:bifunctional metallophosphatase/5'-nucleotidase [Piscinibacter sp.]|uniref:bifunctional metallophosphatase/5'-nucleotidase n=1 Tax=Piscinibacter sp. TaxID=1903157 RepID=UPI002ED50510
MRALVFAGVLAFCGTAFAARPIELRLIGINDFHGNLEASGLGLVLNDPRGGAALQVPAGGAAALAGMVHALRATAPHTLTLSAGDLVGAAPLISTLFRHESTISVMNAIGLDAAAVGNHEFDAGIVELRRLQSGGCLATEAQDVIGSCRLEPYTGAKFAMLASNVLDARRQAAMAPYVIKRVAGIPVGIIGAVTKATPDIVIRSGVAGLRFTDEADGINRAARELRRRGVRAMIALVHEGGELGVAQRRGDWNDANCLERSGPIFGIAARLVPEISVIFSGHTHQGYRCVMGGRTIVSATSYGRGISVVDVRIDPRTRRIMPALTTGYNLPVLNDSSDPAVRERLAAHAPAPYAAVLRTATPDPDIARQVARYAAAVAATADRQVGTVQGHFGRTGESDSAAGRLIADAQLAATRAPSQGGAQIAFTNKGGIRSDLGCGEAAPSPCALTFGQVFAMQPFGNSLVVMTLTGAQLKALLESQDRGGDLKIMSPSAGFMYAFRKSAVAGDRVRDMQLEGEAVVPDHEYRVTVNSFMAEGGDGFGTLVEGKNRFAAGRDLDALLKFLKPPAVRSPTAASRVTLQP